ncbi:MAG: preprotein translocase subunit YajC [Clostridia bacterium]|nr:preprotein translocase subunit YajC [Clostridia bacterium]
MEAAADAGSGSPLAGYSTIIMIVAMVAIFYFLLYRPQKKQEKETARMRNSLEVGDEITTIGGIIGAVVSIKEDTVTIETGKDRCKIRIHRSAVRSIDVKANEEYEETK